MRWVAFWSLLYVSLFNFSLALFSFLAAFSLWNDGGFNARGAVVLLAIACGLALTGAFLLLRHLWAYVLSVVLATGLSAMGAKMLLDSFYQRYPLHLGRDQGLILGVALGVPALLALIVLLLPPTWREVGLDVKLRGSL